MKKRLKQLGENNLIGSKVTALRKSKKITQKELMSQMQIYGVDINYTSLSKLEGQTRIATDKEIFAISAIFGITPNDLLDFKTKDNL